MHFKYYNFVQYSVQCLQLHARGGLLVRRNYLTNILDAFS